MKVFERSLSKYFLNSQLPSDSVLIDTINEHIGCSAKVIEHNENYVVVKFFEDDEIDVKLTFKPLSYDESRYYITEIKTM